MSYALFIFACLKQHAVYEKSVCLQMVIYAIYIHWIGVLWMGSLKQV